MGKPGDSVPTEFDLDIDDRTFRESPVYQAIISCDRCRLLRCLQRGDNVRRRDDEFGTTYLHILVSNATSLTELQYIPLVYLLSNAGVEVNISDYSGKTPFEIVLGKNLCQLMVALARIGAYFGADDKTIIADVHSPLEDEMLQWYRKFEPGLWRAIEDNDRSAVTRLMNSWCRVRISRNGESLIRYAREIDQSHSISYILEEYRATMEFIHAALAGDERRMVDLVDNKNIDLNMKDESCSQPRTLRETAAGLGLRHVLPYLTETGQNTVERVKAISKAMFKADELKDSEWYPASTETLHNAGFGREYKNISKISEVTNNITGEKGRELVQSSVCVIM